MNQPVSQPVVEPPMDNGSSRIVWYVVGLAIVIALAGFWYYSPQTSVQNSVPTAMVQQIPTLSAGDSVSDIANDLNQTPDSYTGLDQAAAASVGDVQSF